MQNIICENNCTPIIIGVVGGSGSGKTTLCKEFIDKYTFNAHILCHDSYYKDLSHLSAEKRDTRNFDHPDAFDNDLFYNHLSNLKKGKFIKVPEYDFTTHTRKVTFKKVHPKKLILIEGILILCDIRIRNLCDYTIFLELDSDIRFIRRLERDVKERGRSLDSVVSQYLRTVRPMYMQFVVPLKDYVDVIIDGNDTESFFHAIINYINSVQGRKENIDT